MNKNQDLRERRWGIGMWLTFAGIYGIIAFLFQVIGLGFIKSPGEFIVIAGSNVVLTLLSWGFLPRARPYLLALLAQLIFVGFFAIYVMALLLAQEPVGYEPSVLGWEANLALGVLLTGYLIQIALLVQSLRARKSKQEIQAPML